MPLTNGNGQHLGSGGTRALLWRDDAGDNGGGNVKTPRPFAYWVTRKDEASRGVAGTQGTGTSGKEQ
jgi:hypothetical protein